MVGTREAMERQDGHSRIAREPNKVALKLLESAGYGSTVSKYPDVAFARGWWIRYRCLVCAWHIDRRR